MPNIDLPIRSLSVLFLVGAVIAILVFPDNPATPNLARALFWWFLALGVVRWVETGLIHLLPEIEGGYIPHDWLWLWWVISIGAFLVQAWCLIRGIGYFGAVLANL